MKIAVVGIGVAGAYLMNQLSGIHDVHVQGFERMPEKEHDAVCAWATCDNVMKDYAKICGLNFEDYILHDGKQMNVDIGDGIKSGDYIKINLKGMISYDKLKLIQDMIKGTKIQFEKSPNKKSLEEDFDVIIDATGFHRHFLPKLENELWIPCIQYKVKYHNVPFDDFYLKAFPSLSGYFWYFPLGNGYAHIGSGDFKRKQTHVFMDSFMKKYPCQVLKKVGRPVRITPPSKCLPFTDGNKTIGVGESIGTVYALLGEGIIPSTICAQLFVENLYDREKYISEVLSTFKIYTNVYNFIRKSINNKFNILKDFLELLKIYKYMKSKEDRFGMEINMMNMMKLTKI